MLDKRLIERSEKECVGSAEPGNKRAEISNLKLSKALSYFIIQNGKDLHQTVESMLIDFLSNKDEGWKAYFENDNMDFELSQSIHFFEKDSNYARLKDKNQPKNNDK